MHVSTAGCIAWLNLWFISTCYLVGHRFDVYNTNIDFFFPVALRPNAGHGLLILDVSRSHTATRHSRLDFSGRVTSASQRPLPDNTHHSQQTDIHAPGGIRTHNLSKRAASDLRLRPRGHWDRLCLQLPATKQLSHQAVRASTQFYEILSFFVSK